METRSRKDAPQHNVNPDYPHRFEPRQHGNPVACRWCGATKGDDIHDVKKAR